MLYQLGLLQFEGTRLAPHEIEREASYDYAEKDVIGALKPAEAAGEGEDEITFTCCLPGPEMVERGIDAIGLLDQMRLSGQHHILVRGDGYGGWGWRRIVKTKTRETYLDRDGIGRVIEFEMTLKKGPKPSPIVMIGFLYTLLS